MLCVHELPRAESGTGCKHVLITTGGQIVPTKAGQRFEIEVGLDSLPRLSTGRRATTCHASPDADVSGTTSCCVCCVCWCCCCMRCSCSWHAAVLRATTSAACSAVRPRTVVLKNLPQTREFCSGDPATAPHPRSSFTG